MQIARLQHIPRIIRQFVESCDNAETKPLLLKIGAYDGITGDPLGDSIRTSEHWSAHLIEPVPEIHARLKQNYPDERRFTCHALAIGSGKSCATFYSVAPEARRKLAGLPGWFEQLGSFVPGHIEKCLGERIKPFVRQAPLPQITLADFMRLHRVPCPTLLHIDTEGLDYEVLETYDFAMGSPRVILVEHKHLAGFDKSRLLDLLSARDYSLVVESKNDLAAFTAAQDALILRLSTEAYTRAINRA